MSVWQHMCKLKILNRGTCKYLDIQVPKSMYKLEKME